jgi:hypothetical protein
MFTNGSVPGVVPTVPVGDDVATATGVGPLVLGVPVVGVVPAAVGVPVVGLVAPAPVLTDVELPVDGALPGFVPEPVVPAPTLTGALS